MIAVLLILVLLVPIAGCRTMPSATGRDFEIVVIVQGDLWEKMESEVRAVLEPPIFGVHTERAFRLIQTIPDDPGPFDRWRKVLVIGTVEGTPLVKELLDEEEIAEIAPGKAYLKSMNDVWALGQYVLLFATEDSGVIERAFAASSGKVFSLMNEAFLEEELRRMFTSGRNTKLAAHFTGTYGFFIGLPEIYRLADEDTLEVTFDGGPGTEMIAVRFYNLNPYRSFFVTWKEGTMGELDEEKIIDMRRALGNIYYPGDNLLPRRIEAAHTDFNGRDALRLRGVWETREKLEGGIFISYALDCPENNRFYLLDGVLYQPDPEKSKYPYLVQMSTILHSFECSADSVDPDFWEIRPPVDVSDFILPVTGRSPSM
jgi:hypothetical protein